MIRILGSAFLLISLSAVGIKKADEVKKRLREMEAALIVLRLYKSELSTSRAPMNAIFDRLVSSQNRNVRLFGSSLKASAQRLGEKDFCSIWSESAIEAFTSLPEDCLTEFCGLGAFLGRYDTEAQLEAIDRCIHTVSSGIDGYKPGSASEAKMYIALYSGMGLIITVMLI